MNKAYYIDTYSTGHLHEMFNASSLLMFATMYDHVEYRASRSSYEHVVRLVGKLPDNVSYQPIAVVNAYKGWKRMRFFYKQIQAILHNVAFILFTPDEYDVIINYNTLAALPAMNRMAGRVRKRILQICHGEMAELAMPYSKNRLLRRGVRLLQSGKNIASNLYFAVLGEAIYKNVLPLVSADIRERLLYFEHSAVYCEEKPASNRKQEKLVVGTIGAMRESKGESSLILLARMLADQPNVEIRCIGKSTLPKQTLEDAGISIPEVIYNKFLTREKLYEQIRQLDYALFLFPPALYRFTASGSVFDAIACGVPILSLSNEYFQGLFANYGDFGYLEKNLPDLARRIGLLVNNGEEQTKWHMQTIRLALSPQMVAEQFRKQWLP